MDEVKGNLLDIQEGVIAHGCNTLGVMGAGFAKQVKERHPEAFREYKRAERASGLRLGEVSFAQVGPQLWIANVLTQSRIYGAKGEALADLDAIEAGFQKVGEFAGRHGLRIEMPLIGCGLAGGDWADIEPRIQAGVDGQASCRLWIYQPAARPKWKGR